MVLHALRCIGAAGVARIAAAAGVDGAEAESELIDLAVAGLVTHEPGEFGGWSLTAAGRDRDATGIAAELAASGVRPAVVGAYDRFLVLNPELLDLCAAWQTRSIDGAPAVNDHADPDYDGRVLGLLADLAHRADPVCADLATVLPRFARYRVRLAEALARAREGERDYVTTSTESFHAVWFQLHEDLLTTLGIPRW